MLTLFAAHGRFDLDLEAKGDLQVDQHHTVEDVGIALGQGRFVHAPSSRGVVRVEPYTASYWARRFVGAPVQVADRVAVDAVTTYALAGFSPAGTLVYQTGAAESQLVLADIKALKAKSGS